MLYTLFYIYITILHNTYSMIFETEPLCVLYSLCLVFYLSLSAINSCYKIITQTLSEPSILPSFTFSFLTDFLNSTTILGKFFLDLYGSTQLYASDLGSLWGYSVVTLRVPRRSLFDYSGVTLGEHWRPLLVYSGATFGVPWGSNRRYPGIFLGVPWESLHGYSEGQLGDTLGWPGG